jgi:iron complex transport system substrate-binding protein
MYSKYRYRVLISIFIVALVLTACGAPQAVEDAQLTESTDAAFPITIEHKYGSTTINEKPERIVLVGLTEQDALLALGVVPVATREWYGERPGAIFEWAQDKLGDAPAPEVLPSVELNFEQIAALQPDVIVGLYSGTTAEEYETLSKIAPTIAQPAEYVDYGIPWQELTRKIGLIVGKSAEAEKLVADVEAQFASVREQHPEFADATGVIASTWGFPDTYYAYHSQDPRNRFLTSLGFVIPAEVDEMAQDSFGASISRERLDIVDVDALVWITFSEEENETIKNDALYQNLAARQEGRDIFIAPTDPLYDALNFNTILSLPFTLDRLVPQLAAAVDGDPATTNAE